MAADASTTTDPARQRRRRIGFAALAAVCVVGALAIGLSVKDKGKKPAAAAAKTDKGAFFPMADLLGGDSFPIVAEPGRSTAPRRERGMSFPFPPHTPQPKL